MTEHLKHLKTFEFHSITMCPFFFRWMIYLDAASKFNIKVHWSSRHFSQNYNIRIKHRFSCNNVRHVPREILKAEGDRSGGYRGKLDERIVNV